MIGRALLSGLVFVLLGSPAVAGPFEQGHTAYMRGDYRTSLKHLRPLAESGHAAAAYILGRHYQLGQGVARDLGEAWFWYRRAEARGHVEAALFRHLLVTKWKISAADLERGKTKFAALSKPAPETTRATWTVAARPRKPVRPAPPATAPPDDDRAARVALRPSARPKSAPEAAVTVAGKPRPTVRVTELAPTHASPTPATASTPGAKHRRSRRSDRSQPPAETAVRSDAPDDDAVETEDDYEVAIEPGTHADMPRFDPGPDRPAWVAPPPAPVIAPGYWQYRAWRRYQWQMRRAWRHHARRTPGWRRGWRRGRRQSWRRY